MAFDYDRMVTKASSLITDFGRSLTLRQVARPPASGLPWDPSSETPTNIGVVGVVLDYDDREIDGAVILVGDRRVLISAMSPPVDIVPGDEIVDGADKYRIVNPRQLKPGPVTLLWEMQVRR